MCVTSIEITVVEILKHIAVNQRGVINSAAETHFTACSRVPARSRVSSRLLLILTARLWTTYDLRSKNDGFI